MSKKYTYDFPMPGATATIVIFFNDMSKPLVLLGKRKDTSLAYPGYWGLIGGFLNTGTENMEQCIVRETMEEARIELKITDPKLLMVVSDPRVDTRYHVVNVCYWNEVDAYQYLNAKPGDDIQALKWVSPTEAMKMELAFNHNEILLEAHSAWRAK